MPKKIFRTISITLSILLLSIVSLYSPKAFAAGSSVFSMSPNTATIDNGNNFQVNLVLTNSSNAQTAKAVVTYDVAKLAVTTIAPGVIYTNYTTSTFDNTGGSLTVQADTPNTGSIPSNATDIFATITFHTLAVTTVSTDVRYDTGNTALSDSGSASVPYTNSNGSYTIADTAVAATPTPTPTSLPQTLPQTGIADEIFLPLSISMALIIAFFAMLFLRNRKDSILKQVLSKKK